MKLESTHPREPLSLPVEPAVAMPDDSRTSSRAAVEDARWRGTLPGSAGADDDGHGHPADDDPEL